MSDIPTPRSNDVPKPIQVQLIQQDLQIWRNTRWQAEMRHRVATRIGGDLKGIEDELVKAEGAIAELEAMLKEVQADA